MVSFILIPGTLRRGLGLDNFFKPLPVIMHNANVLLVAVEMALNRVPFNSAHHPYVLLFAAAYVLFAWIWFEIKHVFYYGFLDYARPLAFAWYSGLLVLLLGCFSGGAYVSTFVKAADPIALMGLAFVTWRVMRVKK